jgi:PAS domain S-box-containing protein
LPELYQLMAEQVRDYALFLLDPTGHVMSWNLGAKLAKGYEAHEIIGQYFGVFYTPDANARQWPAFELAEATREGRFEDEGWRVRKDGSRFWANVVITALRDAGGRLVAFSKITRDLTERRRQEEDLRQSEERFRLLVEGVVDYAVYMLDPNGMVTSWNAGAQRIKGYSPEEIIGKHYSRFFLGEDVAASKPWEELAAARRDGRAEVEGWRLRKNGERFWARVVVSPLHDGGGALRGFAKVTQDLTQRRHLQELETTARKLNEFIAMLAHELRNPLAPIHSALAVMKGAEGDEAKQARMRQVIERQTRRLSRVVDDMADIGRITRGALSMERKPVALAQVMRAAAEATDPLIRARGHELAVAVGEGLVVHGDVDRLVQVFANLLENAAKYTPPRGRIEVEAHADAEGILARVRDTGRGLHAEELQTIFQMFVQGRNPLERSAEGGMGIGLALARSIVELHGGSIEARSKGPGQGSEFLVRLPAAAADALPAPADAALASAARQAAKRILIVDDNVDAAHTLDAFLKELGHETHVVYDGAAAIAAFEAFKPQIVLLDIGLPGLSGYEVARQLRARQPKGVKIVAVTGWGSAEDRRQSAEAGFDLHVVKPLDEHALQTALQLPENGTVH